MVSTRRSVAGGPPPDENRMIVVVTGANSGFGLGICQQLLSNLSLPPGTPLPASTPLRSALPPHQRDLFELPPKATKEIPVSPPPTLTLILACRSQKRAQEAKDILLKGHEEELQKREEKGLPAREGWKEGLRIEIETIDMDALGYSNGVLAFCERVKNKYPHITTMYLNAGLGAYSGLSVPRFIWQMLTEGLITAISMPKFQKEIPRAMSADGSRGMVWGVNVLAPYVLVKELSPLLAKSPDTLPFPPRAVYTSSGTATFDQIKPDVLDDYQLLSYGADYTTSSYKASKYCGDMVMAQLDLQLAEEAQSAQGRSVRIFTVDPGCVCTSIFDGGFGTWALYASVMKFFYWLTFYFGRLLGSTVHPVYPTEGALPMLYAALIDEQYVEPADKVPAQKFKVHSSRWGKTTVDYGEIDKWEDSLAIGEGMVRACEAVRTEWKRKEGLE